MIDVNVYYFVRMIILLKLIPRYIVYSLYTYWVLKYNEIIFIGMCNY